MGIFDSIKRKLGYDIINNNGVNEIYRPDGILLSKKYQKQNGEYHGKYLEFNVDKNKVWVEKEINYKNGVEEGVSRFYWKKHISAEGNFSNGKITGVIKKYFKYEDELKDVNRHPVINKYADLDKGIFKAFSLDGILLEESEIDSVVFEEDSSLEDGYYGDIYPKRNGLCTKWFENGKIQEKGLWGKNNTDSIYNLGHRKDKHILYYENGEKFKEGEWENKLPSGIHKFYYPNGDIEFEIDYEKSADNSFEAMFPDEAIIINEKWFNEDGSLMNANQIIRKAGIDPRTKSQSSNKRMSWAHDILNKKNHVMINGMRFKRMGEVKFYYDSYDLNYYLGHSYSQQ